VINQNINQSIIRSSLPPFPSATFTILCYNVLCDKYATTNLYSYCPQWALNWEYRKQSIIKEICHYDADVITLQVWWPAKRDSSHQ
jgi:mRNA deadenylase 3'-5' endonuclease subunit Ccr4